MKFSRMIVLGLGFILAAVCCIGAFADSDNPHRERIEIILLTEEEGDMSAKDETIRAYSNTSGLSLSNTIGVIETIVSSTLTKEVIDERDSVLLESACYVLGELGAGSSSDVLRNAASSASRSIRISAMLAYVKTAREDCLPFAEEVVTKKDVFQPIERYELYKSLAPYAKPTEKKSLDEKRRKVRKFLVKATEKESESDCAKKLDDVLLSVLPSSYKSSVQRYKLAMRFKDSKVPSHAKYFAGVASGIAKVPVRARKNLLNESGAGTENGVSVD